MSTAPLAVVVMGVCGCGKSTVGERLARELGALFIEGDAFHPPANVARMAAGIALTDADRQGWLEALAAQLACLQDAAAKEAVFRQDRQRLAKLRKKLGPDSPSCVRQARPPRRRAVPRS